MTQVQWLNDGYELFCEIMAEPTHLSGAGRYHIVEVAKAFQQRFGVVPTQLQLDEWEDHYHAETEHIMYNLGGLVC